MRIPVLIAGLLFFLQLNLPAQERKITILHTNDMHSRLQGFAPESAYSPLTLNNDKTIGGFARIAAVLKTERQKPGQATLIIDAGDFLMGTLFHTMEERTGFQLPLMKEMGYDIVAIGNHEFDFGPQALARIITKSAAAGKLPVILLGNAIFSPADDSDNSLEELFRKEIIRRTFIKEVGGIRIGFFSLLGKDAVNVAPMAKPVTFGDQTAFSEKAAKELRSQGCEIVICISHSGVTPGKNGQWSGEDAELAARVKDIDLIISGHTHTRLDKPVMVNGIPVVQAGEYGEYIGKAVLALSDGKVKLESYELIPVDDRIMGDRGTDSLIKEQEDKITERILKPNHLDYLEPLLESPVSLECNEQGNLDDSNLGPLVADAIHWYLNRNSAAGDDVSMISAGVIRDKMMPGVQSTADIFRIVPLGFGSDSIPGYPLARTYLTGRELKNTLEVLLVAQKSNPDYHCFFSGFRAEYDPGKRLLKKISKLEIVHPDGKTVNVSFRKKEKALYSVAANSYMLQFIGVIKKKTHGLINVIPKDINGDKLTDMSKSIVDVDEKQTGLQEGKEWIALIGYLSRMKDTNNNGIPDLDPGYFKPVRIFSVVKK